MNTKEHLLVCLAEECAEVAQAVGKALRFGLYDTPPKGGLANNDYLVREFNDVLAIIELLQANGANLDGIGCRAAIDEKKAKVGRYMLHAELRGTLESS